ncbi:MAG: hypothetical protein EAZ57_00335 [Cytophagales bacterium]|nr:MAG: hypothetical protein EAZ57_00335 [Cytophagales bacterium]
MKKLIILLSLFISVVSLYAQNPLKINVIPPSPNAASLGKYGDIPVSLHTGVPNISIPIYEVRNKDLSLPISLSYHSSGIRVAETASWVGLGWALNAGGMITRTVQHLPDEGRSSGTNNPAGTGYYDFGYTLPPDIIINNPNYNSLELYDKYKKAAQGLNDSEPDIFSYSLNGYSGKFMFDQSKNPVFFPEEDIKVAVNYNTTNQPNKRFISFTLTTPDGTKYYFGENNAKEYTSSLSNYFSTFSGDFDYVCSSWYLTKIESVNGDIITLEYQDEEYSFFDLAAEYYILPLPNPNATICADPKNVSFTSVRGKKLWRIISAHSVVEFHANTKRQDLAANINVYNGNEVDLPADQASDITYPKAPKKLDKILIKDKEESNPSIWKEFILQHSYFEADVMEDNSAILNKVKFKTDKKRLKLVGVTERDYTTQYSKPPYLFEYEEKDNLGQTVKLPRRISLAQDRQGYYNGYLGNLTLVDLAGVCANGNNPNRNPNFNYAKIGILKSITYPTGGRTTFSYQQHLENEYTPVGGLRIFEIRNNDGLTNIERVKRYEYQEGILYTKPTYLYTIYRQQFVLSNGQTFWHEVPYALNGNIPPNWFQIMSSNSIIPMQTTQGFHIGYRSVTVREIGTSSNNGYTTYLYDQAYTPYPSYGSDYIKISSDSYYDGTSKGYPEIQSQIYKNYPLRPPLHRFQRGNLLFENHYTETNKKLSSTEYIYETYNYAVASIKATKLELIMNVNGENLPYAHYPIFSGKSRLTSKIERIYDQSDNTKFVETTMINTYRSDKTHLQPITTTTTNSVGEQLITLMKYPLDYTFTGTPSGSIALGIKNLQSKNIISPVIEKYTIRKNGASERVTSGMITTFKESQPLPDKIFLMNGNGTTNSVPPILNTTTGSGLANFKPSELGVNNSFIRDDNYEERATFHTYDLQGNLLEHSKTNDVRTTFIWGYNNTLPIAEVVNHRLVSNTRSLNLGLTGAATQSLTYLSTAINVPNSYLPSVITIKSSVSSSDLNDYSYSNIKIVIKNNTSGTVVYSKDILPALPTWQLNEIIPSLLPGSYRLGYQISSNTGANISINTTLSITSYSQNLFHTSFEENGEADIDSKTGKRRYSLASGAYILPSMLAATSLPAEAGKRYVLSFWYKTNAQDAKWELFENKYTILPTSIGSSFVNGKTITHIDEVRIFPENAMMTTMTYDPLVGKTSVTDPNNVTTYFEYDGLQRLRLIRDQDRNIIQKKEYNYKKQN